MTNVKIHPFVPTCTYLLFLVIKRLYLSLLISSILMLNLFSCPPVKIWSFLNRLVIFVCSRFYQLIMLTLVVRLKFDCMCSEGVALPHSCSQTCCAVLSPPSFLVRSHSSNRSGILSESSRRVNIDAQPAITTQISHSSLASNELPVSTACQMYFKYLYISPAPSGAADTHRLFA